MTQIAYFSLGVTPTYYDPAAVNGYVGRQSTLIDATARTLGMLSIKTAIAGAMAEENHSFLSKELLNKAMDLWAQHGFTFTDIDSLTEAGLIALLPEIASNLVNTRTHEEWAANYAAYKASPWDTTTLPYDVWKFAIKQAFPVLVDLGLGKH